MSDSFSRRVTLSLRTFMLILLANVIVLALVYARSIQAMIVPSTPTPTATLTVTQTPAPSQTPTTTRQPSSTPERSSAEKTALLPGWLVLSIREAGTAHLFLYQPGVLPLTRITDHPWDDITPSISPDGAKIAYASRENGYYDLFLLDLASGQSTRLTDTGDYDASPTWSPDLEWLAYESYFNGNLEILIRSLTDPTAEPIRLTDDPGADFSPAWSPTGRIVAFVSDRTGHDQIWLANLDVVDDRYQHIPQPDDAENLHPFWSADGTRLYWTSLRGGEATVMVWDSTQPDQPAHEITTGGWAAASPDGASLLALEYLPNQYRLNALDAANGQILLPPQNLPGELLGMDWTAGDAPQPLPAMLAQAASGTPEPLWEAQVATVENAPTGRVDVVPLDDVSAPQPYLSDEVDEAFTALRQRVAADCGWDVLISLENAYVPLTSALSPGMENDWLYTGRAFAFNPAPLTAGWMALVREDYQGEIYWHVYLKARYQDGSQGTPIAARTWDLNARYNGDPIAYEAGGKSTSTAGYWIDFTALAASYGWERVPAMSNWRTYYAGTRFNEMVQRDDLTWQAAMLKVYPPEAMLTLTPVTPPTITPTITPYWIRVRTATPTPTATATPTRRPTWTPLPSQP
ncbi:MAG: hypothetical protein ABFD44_07195 [Anaerolineaceae bacterium]